MKAAPGLARENVHDDLRASALAYFDEHEISWWLSDGERSERKQLGMTERLPTRHLMLRLLEQGRSTKQIAAELHLSTETIRNHIRRLFRALGVQSRLEAVAAARAASPH
jgi:DNA-binding NarL/FixJ family response regulator